MTNIYQILERHGIPYKRTNHPPVYTIEEAERLVPPLAGAKTKNLFLRDNKGKRHFLVVVNSDTKVDLKRLHTVIDSTRVSFASADRLKRHLDLEPGAVSMLAVVNDAAHQVELIIDRRLWEADAFQCHPLVNTSTLVLPRQGLEKLFGVTGHVPLLVNVPEHP